MLATDVITAASLLATVRPFGAAVEGLELVFDDDLPPDIVELLRVLHTGVRALIASRKWFGCEGKTGRIVDLLPAFPVPEGITLLAVEKDTRWDRIHPSAWVECPRLFAGV